MPENGAAPPATATPTPETPTVVPGAKEAAALPAPEPDPHPAAVAFLRIVEVAEKAGVKSAITTDNVHGVLAHFVIRAQELEEQNKALRATLKSVL